MPAPKTISKKNDPLTTEKKKTDSAVHFSVDSQLIGELGERLVASNYIALSELIKNAYDADSASVKIELNNITKSHPGPSSIIVSDEGNGMTLDQVKQFWMKIATPNKSQNTVSKRYGRPVTGNKGIGRFACQKISERLELISIAESNGKLIKTSVVFNWRDFVPGTDIDSVPCEFTTTTVKSGTTGVTLHLINLREKWTDRDYKMLLKNVSLVSISGQVKRQGFDEDPGFKIVIKSEEFESYNVNVGRRFLNAGWGLLKGEILPTGKLELTLKSKGNERSTTHTLDAPKSLADLSFEVFIIPKASTYEIENRRDPKLLTNVIRDEIRENQGGIRLYLNNFRIYPYGDISSGDDWLGISRDIGKRRASPDKLLNDIGQALGLSVNRAMLTHPAAEALIGSVKISGRATKAFAVKMNREGLVENEAFENLKKLLRLSLDWMALHHDAFIRKEIEKNNEDNYKKMTGSTNAANVSPKEKVDLAIRVIKEASANYSKKDDSRAKSDSTAATGQPKPDKALNEKLSEASSVIQSQFDALAAELDTLRSVASTASLLFVFSHEFKGILASLLTHAAKLEDISSKVNDNNIRKLLVDMANEARAATQQYTKITKLFDVFSDSKNFHGKKAMIKLVVDQVKGGFGYLFSQFSIEMSSNITSPVLKIPRLNEAEIYSVIINAVSNSVKAVIAVKGKRKIQVDVEQDNSDIFINILDTGIGLSQTYWKDVFTPFVSDPENKIYSVLSSSLGDNQLSTLGKGSGLGLHIVNSIITKHKGTVKFTSAPSGWKTCLQIKIPK